jgi:hypothetical protein
VWSVPYRADLSWGETIPVALLSGDDRVVLVANVLGMASSLVELALEPRPANHQGLWWRSPAGSAPGWGLNLAQQGDVIFGAWFTYGLDGQPDWYYMPALVNLSLDIYAGDVHHARGPAFNSPTFDPAQVRTSYHGPAQLSFGPDQTARFELFGTDAPPAETVTPYRFAARMPTCEAGARAAADTNVQDLWWADPPGSESGWGLFLADQDDALFLTWFTYLDGGKATWFFASGMARTGARSYRGPLYRASGPTFRSNPWPAVVTQEVGSATLDFTDIDHGVFRYEVDGVAGSKRITRNAFASPGTVCR